MTTNIKYKGYFADCYVLSDNRSSEFIKAFLETFIPNRKESADEYEVPQYSNNPFFIFRSADKLIDHLVIDKNEKHTIYWKNAEESTLKGAMCFFTDSGQIIIGLYCETAFPDTMIEDIFLIRLKTFAENPIGYIAYEEPIPDNTSEFLEKAQRFDSEKNNSNPAQ